MVGLGNCVIRFESPLRNITFLKVDLFDYEIISFRPERSRLQKRFWFVMVSESKKYYGGHVLEDFQKMHVFKNVVFF